MPQNFTLFTRSEKIVLAVSLAALAGFIVLGANGPFRILWGKFLVSYLFGAGVILVGLFYRLSGRSVTIGAVFVNTGLFVLFTNSLAPLNYLIFPSGSAGIDLLLMQWDAAVGFDWQAFVYWFEPHPYWSRLLSAIYQSSLLQILLVIVFLGLTRAFAQLERFILIGCFSSCFSLLFWSLWPSFGPTQTVHLPEAVISGLGLVVDPDYSAHLTALRNGDIVILEPKALKGLIAFPSMHTVFFLMCAAGTLRTRIFPLMLALNAPMPVAVLLHGGTSSG